eukprot:TRINITY_DN582_c0_g1_i1.p1 TRINITY_DN582_c0_g1~~TRINITY_DN582_c0_g1_i1.p1  ORF type:complete len:391 (-),score=86.46 TRINITY_DN582_c0_g1_i1:6-1178(-)
MYSVVFLLLFTLGASVNANCENTGTLQKIVDNDRLRFIFVGGKGGVGKTTTSSSLATLVAQHRSGRVLLVSTDPAHSLSDAFKLSFTSEPQEIPGVDGLDVMEINPQTMLQSEIHAWSKIAADAGLELAKEVDKFRQWLTSVPGIDEATALASVISYIESGRYEVIIFDTAPTGHTLKLLQLPEVLQLGLNQLQGWQSKLWGYYETFKGFMSFGLDPAKKKSQESDIQRLKRRLETKLKQYKEGIEKVATMITDKERTTFLAVCIAEYLSISETERLLHQLKSQDITCTHVVVNQLVLDTPTTDEIHALESTITDKALVSKVTTSLQLLRAREEIQSKYIHMLEESPAATCLDIVKVPLLAREVTGVENLKEFSQMLLSPNNSDQEKEEL